MKSAILLLSASCFLGAASAFGATIFSDDFESLAAWTTTGSNSMVVSTAQNRGPGGTASALSDTTADRMHNNLNTEVGGASIFTFSLYYNGTAMPRTFAEVRGYSATGLPDGGNIADGGLQQLFAAGVYNSVTMSGETYDSNYFQARLTFGSTAGWFNLKGGSSPTRSIGWHDFAIERLADGTSINFYVDGILSRSFTGATASDWDTVIIGSALGTAPGTTYFDNLSVVTVPEAGSTALLAGAALLGLRRRRRSSH